MDASKLKAGDVVMFEWEVMDFYTNDSGIVGDIRVRCLSNAPGARGRQLYIRPEDIKRHRPLTREDASDE